MQVYKCLSLCSPISFWVCAGLQVFESVQVYECLSLCRSTSVWVYAGLQVFESVQVYECLSLCSPTSVWVCLGLDCWNLCRVISVRVCAGLLMFVSVSCHNVWSRICFENCYEWRDFKSRLAFILRPGWSGFRIPVGKRIFFSPKPTRLAQTPPSGQLFNWYRGSFWGKNRPEREVYHWNSSSADVKYECNYISCPSTRLHAADGDNFIC